MVTNWLVRFNGTDKTVIIPAQTCDEAMKKAGEDNKEHGAVRSVRFHSAGSMCVSTEGQHYANLVGVAAAS